MESESKWDRDPVSPPLPHPFASLPLLEPIEEDINKSSSSGEVHYTELRAVELFLKTHTAHSLQRFLRLLSSVFWSRLPSGGVSTCLWRADRTVARSFRISCVRVYEKVKRADIIS